MTFVPFRTVASKAHPPTFRPGAPRAGLRRAAALALALLASIAGSVGAGLAEPVAVVPTEVIYPGQEIVPAKLREVAVNNPNLRRDYVRSIAEVSGRVAQRTLLPGRVIPPAAVREPFAVERGKRVQLVYSRASLTIMALGTALQDGVIGDFVRVRNLDSGVAVSGTVAADGTVQVAQR